MPQPPRGRSIEAMTEQSPPRPLRRARDHKYAAGVARGLAEYANVDPVIFRVLFVVLTFFGGVGALLYIAGWLLMPREGDEHSLAESLIKRPGEGRKTESVIEAVLLAIVGALVLASLVSRDTDHMMLLVAVGVGGYLLYRKQQEDDAKPATAPKPVEEAETTAHQADPDPDHVITSTEIDDAVTARPAYDVLPTDVLIGNVPPGMRAPLPPPPPPPPAPRKRSPIGRITLSTLVVVLGALGFFDGVDVISLGAQTYLGVALAIVGLGLFAGAWLGRSRGLIVLGIPLTLAVFAVGALDPDAGPDTRWTPTSLADLKRTYEMSHGTATLDLRQIRFNAGQSDLRLQLGVGRARIILPDNVDVTVRSTVGVGSSDVLGQRDSGLGQDETKSDNGADGKDLTDLRLRVVVGVGTLEVDRA